MDVLLFLAGALFWTLLVAVPGVYLYKKVKASSAMAVPITRSAEATLVAVAQRLGATRDEPRTDRWGTQYLSKVHYPCPGMSAALTYGMIQGSSKIERVMLPYLILQPSAGSAWRESPEGAIQRALAAIGHRARRAERYEGGFIVYLEPPEKRRSGNFAAPLVEGIVDVDTLVQMVEVSCQAARSAIVAARPLAH